MCGLCGVLGGGEHWTDRPGDRAARRRERLEQVRLANAVLRHYGLKLADWQGASFLLTSRTGRMEVVDSLGALWAVAARLAGRRLDPLDPTLVAALEGHGRAAEA
jgi:hypothetical protein